MPTSLILDYQQQFNNQLQALLAEQPDSTLQKAINYACINGGKRLRPMLVYATCDSFGLESQQASHAALALELTHCYSLVHDDLPAIDDDDFRRNQPSCHKVFGEAIALLAGDALQTLAFKTLLNTEVDAQQRLNLQRYFTVACQEMVQGQALELTLTPPFSQDTIREVHSKKTAALIRCALELAGVMADVANNTFQLLQRLGQLLGNAFQLQDDLLDYEKDQHNQLPNLAVLLGKASCLTTLEDQFTIITSLIAECAPNPAPLQSVVDWLQNYHHTPLLEK